MSDELTKSDMILTHIANSNLAERIVDVDEEMISLLVFQLGDYLFAFHGDQVREILPFAGTSWIPGATASIPGVINVRGDVVALIALGQAFGDRNTGAAGAFSVLLRHGDGRSGILVDNIVDVAAVPVSGIMEILPTLEERFKRFASGQFEYKQTMVTILDAALILAKVEL
ncbi:chemotaxis protein CheW [Sporomusa aerivorans]|uniref:chemotaxis protein CheW n=1 Tax=Sporomusa aerivorans TaxID=204936 RepID=UPI00352ADE28